MSDDTLIYWHPGLPCVNDRWEAAYNRFESPEQERAKFHKRFQWLGLDSLPADAAIADLFCGRGNGLAVLQSMGFTNLTGVDLSPDLLRQSPDSITRIVADCTDLKFNPASMDAFIVQGGLHHLPEIPADLDKCLESVIASLKPGGYFFIVEPWNTPFLRCVHRVTAIPPVRKILPKFDAFATMVEEEIETYSNWLSRPEEIRKCFEQRFIINREQTAFGKWMAVLQKP